MGQEGGVELLQRRIQVLPTPGKPWLYWTYMFSR
jgi:hypothetical protein